MKNFIFYSMLAIYLQGFIDYKRALGYKYNAEAYIIKRFDTYWQENIGDSTDITRESLQGWMERSPREGLTSRSSRISTIRQLTIYMNGIGKEAYIPTEKYVKNHPVIHVLSMEEIAALFRVIDEYVPKRYPIFSIRMRQEYKVLFRLILTTGLRRTEAVSIRMTQIDWSAGTVMILDGKGRKDRLVYLSEDMLVLLKQYREYIAGFIGKEPEWLFPSFDIDDHVSSGGVAIRFKKYWKMTLYSQTCEKDPTIHALRHTYVVIRINQWITQGVDINVMLPYLSRQLGHKSPDETFYYYHQVQDAFRIIREKDSIAPAVIPEVRAR